MSDLRDFVSRPGCRTLGLRSTRTSSSSKSNLGLRPHDPDCTFGAPNLGQVLQTSDLRTSGTLVSRPGCRTSGLCPTTRTFGTSSHDPDVGPSGLRPRLERQVLQTSDVGPRTSDFGPSGPVSRPGCRTFGAPPLDSNAKSFRPQTLDLEPRTSDLRDFVSRPGCRTFGTLSHDPDLRDFVSRPGCRTFGAPPSTRTPSSSDLRRWTSNLGLDLRDFVSRPGCRTFGTLSHDPDLRDFVSRPGCRTFGAPPLDSNAKSFRPQTLDLEPRTSDLRDFISRPGHWTSGLCPTTRTFHMIVSSRAVLSPPSAHRH